MRLFLAVPLPSHLENLRQLLHGWSSQLPDWKWVTPKNLHITLKFLGNVESERLGILEEAIGKALAGLQVCNVALQGLGGFPEINNPRVIWMGISQGAEQLAEMADRLEKGLSNVGFEREERPWKPHLTLARGRPGVHPGDVSRWLSSFGSASFGSFRASAIGLMESRLFPSGPIYNVRREFPLEEPT